MLNGSADEIRRFSAMQFDQQALIVITD